MIARIIDSARQINATAVASLVLLTTTFGFSGAATAAMCQQGYEKELAAAIASGDARLIAALKALTAIPVYDVKKQVICQVKVQSDIKNDDVIIYFDRSGDMIRNPEKYGIGIGLEKRGQKPAGFLEPGYDPLVKSEYGAIEQLRINEEEIHTAETPMRVKRVVDEVHGMNFAGIRIGQSLQEVFDILLGEGYSQQGTGANLNIYKKNYRYNVECDKQRLTLASTNNTTEEFYVPVCHVGPLLGGTDLEGLSFGKIDSDGTRYGLVVDFTNIDDMNRENALKNAHVTEINASVVMKAQVGIKFYEGLADQKYGTKRTDDIAPGDVTHYKYGESRGCLDCLGTGFRIVPTIDGLTVRIKDEQYIGSQHEALVERSLAAAKRQVQTVAKPKF
jgi:hypothetical protein